MNQRQSILTKEDVDDFLIYLYFGKISEPLTSCLDRAYRDFNRTLHGIQKMPDRSSLHTQARDLVGTEIDTLRTSHLSGVEQRDFDAWHQHACAQLVDLYTSVGQVMYLGQAQKWFNMTIKYIFTLGNKRVPGFDHVYPVAHIPLDTIILDKLEPYHPPQLTVRWSRIKNYTEYLTFQEWMRSQFSIAPLDVEFLLWLGKGLPKDVTDQSKDAL